MAQHKPSLTFSREPFAAAGLVICVPFIVIAIASIAGRRDQTITISGGDAAGARHRFAKVLAEESADRGLRLLVEPAAG